MGYRGATPDRETCALVDRLLADLDREVKPAYALKLLPGTVEGKSVIIDGVAFDTPSSLVKIVGEARRFAVFVVTAGQAYDDWAQRIREQGDILGEFVADAMGSAVAESMGQYLNRRLDELLEGEAHSSSFCPGQCKWDISEQRKLFSLLGEDNAGVRINDSFLMHPIKSVSGIIGIGETMNPLITSCSLCPRQDCFRRHHVSHA